MSNSGKKPVASPRRFRILPSSMMPRRWRGRASVQLKVLGSTMLVLSLMTFFSTLYYPMRQREAALAELQSRTRLLGEMVALGVGVGLELNQLSVVQSAVNWAKQDPSLAYVQALDAEGEVFAEYNPELHIAGYVAGSSTLGQVEARGGLLHIAVPIAYREQDHGLLVLGISLEPTLQVIRGFQATALGVSFLALLGGAALANALSRRITDPLRRLRDTADHIAKGHLQIEVAQEGGDEVGRLASSVNVMVARLRDMVEELNANQASLEVARDDALAAARAKSEFLAAMSHEIRTPMNGVLGMLELLEHTPLNPKQARYVSTAATSAEALIRIINDILDFSKLEAGRLDLELIPMRPARVADEVVGLLRSSASEKGLDIELDAGAVGDVEILGDPGRIRQVVLNLAHNAVKFTEQGSVVVRVSFDRDGAGGGILTFVVQDTGIGMDQDTIEGLFDPFTQADSSTTRRFGGTGLGLSIVRRLVDRMEGTISVRSQLDSGTRFEVSIPSRLSVGEQGDVTAAAAERPMECGLEPCPPSPLRILLAEDHETNQFLVTELLEEHGYEVDIVADGRAAFEARMMSDYDAILMDCQMPSMDGLEATVEIRRWEESEGLTRIPILALTASALPGDRERCLAAGMDDHLVKPFARDRLLAAVAEWAAPSRDSACVDTPPDVPPIGPLPERFDTGRLARFVGSDPQKIRRHLDAYLEQTEQLIEELGRAVADGDGEEVRRLSHKAKGASGMVGADRLAEEAARLEGLAIGGDHGSWGGALEVLTRAFNEMRASVAAITV